MNLNLDQQQKIKRFISDPTMNNAVKEVILDQFKKDLPNSDVHEKASQFIAIGKLEKAWKELETYKNKEEQSTEVGKQVGL